MSEFKRLARKWTTNASPGRMWVRVCLCVPPANVARARRLRDRRLLADPHGVVRLKASSKSRRFDWKPRRGWTGNALVGH